MGFYSTSHLERRGDFVWLDHILSLNTISVNSHLHKHIKQNYHLNKRPYNSEHLKPVSVILYSIIHRSCGSHCKYKHYISNYDPQNDFHKITSFAFHADILTLFKKAVKSCLFKSFLTIIAYTPIIKIYYSFIFFIIYYIIL